MYDHILCVRSHLKLRNTICRIPASCIFLIDGSGALIRGSFRLCESPRQGSDRRYSDGSLRPEISRRGGTWPQRVSVWLRSSGS